MFPGKNRVSRWAGVTQLVECDLAKVDVAGSNPVSRSIFVGKPGTANQFQKRELVAVPRFADWHETPTFSPVDLWVDCFLGVSSRLQTGTTYHGCAGSAR